MEREESNDEKNTGAKLLLKQLNWILKAERTTIGGIDGIKEKIKLRVWNDSEGNTKGMNGDRMDMNDKRKPEEGPRNNNTGLDKKTPGIRGIAAHRNKLKKDLRIKQHEVRLLRVSERERVPNLKENSIFLKFNEEINGIIEEILEEDESYIKDINNLIYTVATTMTQTMNQPSKRNKISRN